LRGPPGPLMPPHPATGEQPEPPATAARIEFTPEWALPPGTLLRAEIDARGMTQADLAARAKLTEKHVSQVVTGTVSLTPDVALAFEQPVQGGEATVVAEPGDFGGREVEQAGEGVGVEAGFGPG
jgi:hypothetical protein